MAKEILIADSDKADQKEFQKIFEGTDYHLVFSESGEDALLRAKLFKPDMIIASGAGLQEMGGLELCGAIKGDPDFKQIPFILISSIFDEISEKDRKRFQADGVISRPLNEGEVLHLVDDLMEEEAVEKRGEMVSEKQDFLLDEIGEEEEEIIELVDVVEEPEPRMSIDSFVPSEKGESFGGIASLDSWEKPEFQEKPLEREPMPRSEKMAGEMDLRLKRKMPLKEAAPEEELFDKIELEEILEKVEQLKPSLEKEWPSEKGGTDLGERPFKMEEPVEKYLDLSAFETALQKEIKAELPKEEPRPFFIEEPKKKTLEEALTPEQLVEESLEVPLEETTEELVEESLEESLEEPTEEPLEESLEELLEEEEIKELPEEEFPEELLEDILGEEDIGVIGEPKELEPEEIRLEEITAEEIEEVKEREAVSEIEKTEEAEEIGEIEEIEEMEQIGQIEEMEKAAEIEEIKVDRLAEVEAPKITREEVPSLARVVDKQMQEIISRRVQEMMGEMITKLVPEMTQNVVGFTLERIEKMVREVVPDLAEKAIQEEIKRLQKEEKE
jgi:CheY-like chemotaxis protein